MIDQLLVCIVVILALNLLVNVSVWSRQSATYNRFVYWLRQIRNRR